MAVISEFADSKAWPRVEKAFARIQMIRQECPFFFWGGDANSGLMRINQRG